MKEHLKTILHLLFQSVCILEFYREPDHTTQKCWYPYHYAYTEKGVPQDLVVMSITCFDPNWHADTEATVHMTTDLDDLASHIHYPGKDIIYIGSRAGL